MTTVRRGRPAIQYCAVIAAAPRRPRSCGADDSIRCRTNKLVNVGMVAVEVIALCGEPKSRTARRVPVRARTQTGNVRWSDGHDARRALDLRTRVGAVRRAIEFENGKLVRIDLLN